MLVTLTNTSSIQVDLYATVKWTSTFAREFPTASITVPRTSPAFSPSYIDENGGFLVKIEHNKLGSWIGIANVPTINAEGAEITATHISSLISIRTVGVNRTFTGLTAGAIAKAAVQDATAGVSHAFLKLGTFLESTPHIPQYHFTGQYLSEVFANLMDLTGQEWNLSEDGTINWIAPASNMYSYHLCDDGDIVDSQREGSLNDVLAEVISRGTDGSQAIASSSGQ